MIRALTLWLLHFRLMCLEGQIDHGEALIREHRARLQHAYRVRRKARIRIAQLTPARQLLADVIARKEQRGAGGACQP